MQVEKMKKRGMDIDEFEDYLTMHKYGMPPHGGMGLGLSLIHILNFFSKLCALNIDFSYHYQYDGPEISSSLSAVSYTHLDVYKRQHPAHLPRA